MPGLLPHIDPDGLLEYSVVYTDRALNHMSHKFQGVMTAETPTGSFSTSCCAAGLRDGTMRPYTRMPSAANQSRKFAA